MLPIIDISPLGGESGPADLIACAEAVHAASVSSNCFIAVGHGLDAPMQGLFEIADRLFALPQATKEMIPRIDSFGYVPNEDHAIDASRAMNRSEFFDVGLDDGHPLPDIVGFESAVKTYQTSALVVAAAILRTLATSLDLGPDYFVNVLVNPQCRLRFARYSSSSLGPHGSPPLLQRPHTDYGLITLVATDGVAGLEIKPSGSEWVAVDAPPEGLVVQLGDMLARWTDNRCPPTLHRVVGSSKLSRTSIPFFVWMNA